MSKSKLRAKVFVANLSPEEHRLFKKRAEQKNISMSAYLRYLIQKELELPEEQEWPFTDTMSLLK